MSPDDTAGQWQTAPRVVVATLILSASAGAAHAADVVANFSGLSLTDTQLLNGRKSAPPDTDGAIGINNFVEFINGGFAAYNRNGTLAAPAISDSQFWLNAGVSSSLVNQGLSDPRIKYDPLSQRWFASEITTPSVNNSVLIAVSATSNPLGAWSSTSYVAPSNRFADYPTLNVDANAVYIGTNNFTSSNVYSGVTLTSIPKTSLLAGVPTTTGAATFTQANSAMGFTPQAPTNYGTGYTGTKVVAISATQFHQAQVTPLNNTGAAGATLGASSTVAITFDSNSSSAHQPNGTRNIDTLDDRFSGTIYQAGNKIYAANTIANPNQDSSAVHWMVFDATAGTLLQEGLLTDGTNDLYQPSIAVNDNGDVVICYNESGPNKNISAFAAVAHLQAGVLSFTETLLLFTSAVNNYTDGFADTDPDRWGDYSATMVDPTDPSIFWTIQEVALGTAIWGTQISAINVAAVPEPDTCAMLLAGLGLLGVIRARRKQKAS